MLRLAQTAHECILLGTTIEIAPAVYWDMQLELAGRSMVCFWRCKHTPAQKGKLHFGVILGWSVVHSALLWFLVNQVRCWVCNGPCGNMQQHTCTWGLPLGVSKS